MVGLGCIKSWRVCRLSRATIASTARAAVPSWPGVRGCHGPTRGEAGAYGTGPVAKHSGVFPLS